MRHRLASVLRRLAERVEPSMPATPGTSYVSFASGGTVITGGYSTTTGCELVVTPEQMRRFSE